jgi:hypothetical protein
MIWILFFTPLVSLCTGSTVLPSSANTKPRVNGVQTSLSNQPSLQTHQGWHSLSTYARDSNLPHPSSPALTTTYTHTPTASPVSGPFSSSNPYAPAYPTGTSPTPSFTSSLYNSTSSNGTLTLSPDSHNTTSQQLISLLGFVASCSLVFLLQKSPFRETILPL